MPNLTTSTGAAKLIRNHFSDMLDEYLENTLLAADLCDAEVFPANKGTAIEFHRLVTFNKQTIGLSGSAATSVVPGLGEVFGNPLVGSASQLKKVNFNIDRIVATLQLVGNDLAISELDMMASEPNPIPSLSKAFLYNAADTLDTMYINWMVSNTANGATSGGTVPAAEYGGNSVSVSVVWGDGSATLTEATLDADIPSHRIAAETFNTAEATLRAQSAKPRGDGLFHCLIAPQTAGDLRIDGTFQDIALRGNNRGETKFERASIGEVFGVRVMQSENIANARVTGTIDASNDMILRAPVVGQGYCKRISHAKGVGKPKVTFIPNTHSSADVYGLVAWLVWKAYITAQVVNPLAGVILKNVTTRSLSTAAPDDVGSA